MEQRLEGDTRSFNLDGILNGDLDEVIDALITAHRAEQLQQVND